MLAVLPYCKLSVTCTILVGPPIYCQVDAKRRASQTNLHSFVYNLLPYNILLLIILILILHNFTKFLKELRTAVSRRINVEYSFYSYC